MQKSIFFLLLALLTYSTSAYAQTSDEKAREDLDFYVNNRDGDRERFNEGGDFWYGTGAQLGFGATQFQSEFRIGITPILGYKINNFLSVGPRAGILYNRIRRDLGGGTEFKQGFITWSAGAFARAKVYRGFFAHAEYSLVNEVQGFNQTGPDDFDLIRSTRAIPFAGVGLNQGGGPGQTGFEILVLFRLTQPEVINDSPFEFRTGINWNF